jgi:hypothetical protein
MRTLIRSITSRLRAAAADEPFGIRGALALSLDRFARARSREAALPARFPQTPVILHKLRHSGFCEIDDFLSRPACTDLAERLCQALDSHPALIHSGSSYDQRLHGVENVDEAFGVFSAAPLLSEIARLYLNEPARTAFTLGASMQATPGNVGSGGGWHRDSFLPQFKAMLYLTDVAEDNGPFQIVEGSHKLWRSVRDNLELGQRYGDSRIAEEAVSRLLHKCGDGRLRTLGGPAGTLLLFDSSAIHRGSPIRAGTRMALTNYFYPEQDIGADLYSHFRPVAGHLAPETRATR